MLKTVFCLLKIFPWTRAGEPMARGNQCCPEFFFISIARPESPHSEEQVFMQTNLTAQRLCMNYRCPPNNTASETFLHKPVRREVLTGYLSLGRRPGGDWANT